MDHVNLERVGAVVVATMARGKANALNAALVDELNEAVSHARSENGVRALVLASASQKMFSGGLDLAEVFAYDDETMRGFFRRFLELLDLLRTLPKGVVAAVSGHAYAGGALLALTADFRIMAEGDFGFALNEVNLGLVLPAEGTRWMAPGLGAATREVLLAGLPISPQRALQVGLAAAVVPPDQVRDRAVALATILAEKPPRAFAAIKAGVLEATGATASPATRDAFVDEFMAFWTGEESRRKRNELVQQMRK